MYVLLAYWERETERNSPSKLKVLGEKGQPGSLNVCTLSMYCTFSLLGEKREGIVFSSTGRESTYWEKRERSLSLNVPKKKENRQPKGGMGGRHAATTQGF